MLIVAIGASLTALFYLTAIDHLPVPMAVVILRVAHDRMRGRVMGLRMLAVYGLPLGLLASTIGHTISVIAALQRIGAGAQIAKLGSTFRTAASGARSAAPRCAICTASRPSPRASASTSWKSSARRTAPRRRERRPTRPRQGVRRDP